MAGNSFWDKIGLHDWFLKKGAVEETFVPTSLTPDEVYKYIVEEIRKTSSFSIDNIIEKLYNSSSL